MNDTIQRKQEICGDLLTTVLQTVDNGNLDILEMIIDEYVYKLNDNEMNELDVLIGSILD